jgi:hypothetical protein
MIIVPNIEIKINNKAVQIEQKLAEVSWALSVLSPLPFEIFEAATQATIKQTRTNTNDTTQA